MKALIIIIATILAFYVGRARGDKQGYERGYERGLVDGHMLVGEVEEILKW